jgi:histone-binding protein RBBP4
VSEAKHHKTQKIYISEQTDLSEPNKLVLTTVDIPLKRATPSDQMSLWGEDVPSARVSKTALKTLIHPGEVNKVLELPQQQSIVVTHSDSPDVFVWNFDKQKDRISDLAQSSAEGRRVSQQDVTLKGHTDNAQFALAMCNIEPLVASGGSDAKVLVWNLEDGGGAAGLTATSTSSNGQPTELHPRAAFRGHKKTVGDVSFMPGSRNDLASVADDYSLLFWDMRDPREPVNRVPRAHGEREIYCCDWSELRPTLVATGAEDGGVRVWDKRNLGGALHSLTHHTRRVTSLEWSPHTIGVFGSGSADNLVCIWDLNGRSLEGDGQGWKRNQKVAAPHQLLFQHSGHQSAVEDISWNPVDPWTMMSVAGSGPGAGGTVQFWRMSDLIYRPEEEIMAELEPYKDFIVTGDESRLPLINTGLPGNAVGAGQI